MAPTPPVNSINPIAATPDPEYKSYQWSRAISPIEGNKSSEISLKGFGNVLTEGVNAADTLIKNSLTNSIEDTAGSKRDAYSNELENTLSTLRAGGLKGADAHAEASTDTVAKMDLLSTDKASKQPVPQDLQGLEGTLAKLAAAKANGKQSATQIDAQYEALAKQYRSRWPGYREFIDSTFDRVTQRGPANQLIRSRVAELDAFAANAKEAHNKFETLAMEGTKSIAGFDVTASLWRQGKLSDDQMAHKYNLGMKWKFDEEQAGSMVKVAEAGTKLEGMAAERFVKTTADGLGKGILSTVGSVLDVPGGKEKLDADIKNGNVDDTHALLYAQKLRALLEQGKDKMRSQYSEKGPDGRSIQEKLPEGSLDKLINDNQYIKGIQSTIDLLDSKEHGLATKSQRLLQAQAENDHWQAANEHTELGTTIRMLDAFKGLDPMTKKFLEENVPALTGASRYFADKFNTIYSGQGVLGKQEPEIVTYNHALDEAFKNGLNDPEAFRTIFNQGMTKIASPDVPTSIKLGHMQAVFSPANLGIINRIEKDHTDANGNKVNGKVWLYNQFTNPDIAKEVDRVATATNHPEIRDKYRNFVEKEGQQILATELPKASNIVSGGYIARGFNAVKEFLTPPEGPDRILTSYDNINHTFKLDFANAPPKSNEAQTIVFKRQQAMAQESLDKINTVIKNIAGMSNMMHTNPDADIYDTLSAMGALDPLIKKMLGSMQATAPKKEEPKE